jgi:hypothetical protein
LDDNNDDHNYSNKSKTEKQFFLKYVGGLDWYNVGDSQIKWSGKELAENNSLSIFWRFLERLNTKYAQKYIRNIAEIRSCVDRSNDVHSELSFNVIDENWWSNLHRFIRYGFSFTLYSTDLRNTQTKILTTLSYKLACLCSQTSA